jgi:uncharacterized protein
MTQQITRPHRLVWFEIPASDFDRAVRFYEEILAVEMRRETMGPAKMAVVPYERPAVSGCVMMAPGLKPGADGVLAYLNAEPSLDEVLKRVTGAGGQVVQPRTDLPPGMGVFAKIRDTEGNIVGLHALV